MRDKQQVVLSWVVVALVVLVMIFPIKALFTYGRAMATVEAQPAVAQPTVAVLLTQSALAPTSVAVAEVTAVPTEAPALSGLEPTPEARILAAEAMNAPAAQFDPPVAEAYPAAVQQMNPQPVQPSEPGAVPAAPTVPFQVQSGSPRYMPAFTHTEQGCRWLGVAGQVFDAGGGTRADMVVFISGSLEGQAVNFVAVTGAHSAYGTGGYEITLTDHLPAAQAALTVQLFDLQGQPMSEPVLMNLPNDCGQNLMLVNFQANFESIEFYIPLVAVQ